MGAACVREGERPTTKPGEIIAVLISTFSAFAFFFSSSDGDREVEVGMAAEKSSVSVSACVALVVREEGRESKSEMSLHSFPATKPLGGSQMRAAPEV
jgi:hypothetical protein